MKDLETGRQIFEDRKTKNRIITRVLKDRKTKITDYGLKQGKTERQKK